MIASAALLIRERGVEATSFNDVLAHSGAPRGSIYHHFPGGKAQLVEEAMRHAGRYTDRGLRAAIETGDLATALGLFVASWRHTLESTDFAAGCPVVAVAVAGDQPAATRDAAAAAFAGWEALLAEGLEEGGVAPERARAQATLIVASIEGAVILARAQRSVAPLERVGDELQALVA
jgi:AcrR family transcriptional regulator